MRMRTIAFKIEEELLRELDLYAHNSRNTRSDIIREAIKLYLSMKGALISEKTDSKPGSLPTESEEENTKTNGCMLKGRVYRKNKVLKNEGE